MPRVEFNYDFRKDAWSWVVVARDKDIFGTNWRQNNKHVPKILLSRIQKAKFSEALDLVEEYIKEDVNKEEVINDKLFTLEKLWRPVEGKCFETLYKIMGKPICMDEFRCYMTTGYMCPYKERENWFTVSFQRSLPTSITTICHEIMHFQFLYYYKSLMRKEGLNYSQLDVLKESLTFLLNEPEFSEVISSEDAGYPEHKELRVKLKRLWAETKDFDSLVSEAILLMQ